MWWIVPRGLCGGGLRAAEAEARSGAVREGGEAPRRGGMREATAPPPDPGGGLLSFVASGGRAVVFLDWVPCERLSHLALPERRTAPWLPDDAEVHCGDDAEEESFCRRPERGRRDWRQLERFFSVEAQRVEGSLLGDTRLVLRGRPAMTFATEAPQGAPRVAPWRTVATLDDRPFILERRYGVGRLVLVADSFFVENRALGRGDAAPLVGALVRSYGVPRLDERQHGLRLATGSLSYLLRSPALAAFAGFGLLGLLYVWWARAPRLVPPETPQIPAPSLEDFVGSLALLYSRGGDPDRTAERYRLVSLARLRRHFGLGPDTSERELLARLGRRAGPAALSLAPLQPRALIGSRRALARAVRALDDIVEELSR